MRTTHPAPADGGRLFAAAWTLGFCLLLLVAVGVPAYLQWDENRMLRLDGVTADGVILSQEIAQPRYVRFQFTDAAGRDVIGQALGAAVYHAYTADDPVTVRYLPGRPAVNTIDGHYFAPRWQVFGFPALVVVALLSVAWVWIEARRGGQLA
jgi:hypothetical protein